MVVVPDLFEGKVARSPDEARALMQALDPVHALRTLHDTVNYLAHETGGSSKIGVITSEFNSRYAVALAQQTLRVGSVLIFNGIHASPASIEADTATEAELHRYHPFDYPIVNASPRPVGGVSVRDWAPMLVLNPFFGTTLPDTFAAQLEHGVGWLRRTIAI